MDMLKELLKKKADSASEMDPKYKDAKMGVLKQISDLAAGSMGDDIKGLKKVTVASPDEAGLKVGLDKAKEMLPDAEELDKFEDSDEVPNGESAFAMPKEHSALPSLEANVDEESDEEGEMSHDDIDKMIQDLQDKKAKMMK